MTKSTNKHPKTLFPRCEHRSPSGRHCSQPICSTSPRFCFVHKPKPEELITAKLTEAAGSLSTPEEIHRFLTCVTLLRVQDRLTPKEACAYAYLCQILQRGQREIAFHQKLADDRAERDAAKAREEDALSWSIPRPKMDDDPFVSRSNRRRRLLCRGRACPDLHHPSRACSPSTWRGRIYLRRHFRISAACGGLHCRGVSTGFYPNLLSSP